MKPVCNIVRAALFGLLALVSAETMAQEKVTIIDFAHLGEPLNSKKLGARERNILEKAHVQIEGYSDGQYASINRVVGIAGAKGSFVIVEEHSPSGAGEQFVIGGIVSLESGKEFSLHLPDNSPLKNVESPYVAAIVGQKTSPLPDSIVTHYEDSNSMTKTRYIKNEKDELVSMVWVGNYAKSFKGKKSCTNKGSVLDVDGKSFSIRVRVGSKNLGSECPPIYPEGVMGDKYVKAMAEFETKDKEFYEKLFSRVLAN